MDVLHRFYPTLTVESLICYLRDVNYTPIFNFVSNDFFCIGVTTDPKKPENFQFWWRVFKI